MVVIVSFDDFCHKCFKIFTVCGMKGTNNCLLNTVDPVFLSKIFLFFLSNGKFYMKALYLMRYVKFSLIYHHALCPLCSKKQLAWIIYYGKVQLLSHAFYSYGVVIIHLMPWSISHILEHFQFSTAIDIF